MSIDNVLQSIQQHTPKHPVLLKQLVLEIERIPSNFEKLLTHLQSSESARLRLKQYIERVFEHKDISYCLIESGIANRTGFKSEIVRKIKHKILPESGDIGTLHETLFRISHFNAFTTEQLHQLFAVLDTEVDFDSKFLKNELIDAIEVLSYRITATAIESEFITRFKNNQTVTSFIRQNKEIHALIAQHVLGVQFNPHLVSHIKQLLEDSIKDVAKLRRLSHHQGASLQLSYSLHRTAQQIERLHILLDIYMQPRISSVKLAQFIKQISVNEGRKNSIRSLLNETTYLLAYQISEHESKTGEHYIADNYKEYVKMFFSSCVGGIVAVWMTIVKILLYKLPFAPFWQSFTYSLNYASGFVGIQVLHATLATKQPAMTAAKIAHSLHSGEGEQEQDFKGLALMIGKVARSQFVSFAGNLLVVFPLAAFVALVWPNLFGSQLVQVYAAKKMLHDVHPFLNPTWMYASITGFMLFLSGIISGYYDNKVIYSNIPSRLRRHVVLQKILSKRYLIRFSKYIEHNLGSLVGNVCLGFFLGMAGFIGFIFGIPFDIRHITISSGNYAIAIVTLVKEIHWSYALICLVGVIGIGVFNFLISFSLALFVAIRSRNVKYKELKKLLYFTSTYFRKYPADFSFLQSKNEKSRIYNFEPMGIKSFFAKPFAALIASKVKREAQQALLYQEKIFNELLEKGSLTLFGKDHSFKSITSYDEYKKTVPICDYEQLKQYIDRALAGEENILWPGKPLYWSKTSGTTSGVKYIPLTKDSIPYHINSARNALLCYIAETGNADFVDGKLIFLSGSPVLEEKNGIPVGRLSGIVNHHIPQYLRKNQMPSYATNCIDDWEQKVDAIVEETFTQNMTLISGIPPWVQMYFDKLIAKSGGQKVKNIFPNFKLFVYGGVNFEPYRAKIEESIGRRIDTLETYPASEGFIAYQDSQKEKGLLLLTNNGIFYEFILVDEFFNEQPTRVSLKDIELNKNYAIILNTNAGLFGYNIGDTVKFISKDPYRILVTGRIKHYILAFGEHVIGEEVEHALLSVAKQEGIEIVEFTVAPQVTPKEGGLPYHEWFVEFGTMPKNMEEFSLKVDTALQQKNIYYKDLITGNILRHLALRSVQKNAFIEYMKSEGKLGGQNKVPRLSNDRKIADKLNRFIS